MDKQLIHYLTVFDVSLIPSDELKAKIESDPEKSFEDIFESGEFTIDELRDLTQ